MSRRPSLQGLSPGSPFRISRKSVTYQDLSRKTSLPCTKQEDQLRLCRRLSLTRVVQPRHEVDHEDNIEEDLNTFLDRYRRR